MARALLLIAAVMAATFLHTTFAATYTVGDSTGWIRPTSNNDLYDNWAENKTFGVGDVLVFTFTTGEHDVAEVTEAAYDVCNSTNPISRVTNGPARIPLNSTGDHYYICTITGHCAAGQKLNVEVTSTAPTPGPGSSPTGALTPPTPSSAASLAIASTFSLVFMSILLL